MVAGQRTSARFRLVLDFDKVRKVRESLGLTMDEAATKAGFASRQRWYEIESGRVVNIKIDTLNAIAAALGVKAKDLLK